MDSKISVQAGFEPYGQFIIGLYDVEYSGRFMW